MQELSACCCFSKCDGWHSSSRSRGYYCGSSGERACPNSCGPNRCRADDPHFAYSDGHATGLQHCNCRPGSRTTVATAGAGRREAYSSSWREREGDDQSTAKRQQE